MVRQPLPIESSQATVKAQTFAEIPRSFISKLPSSVCQCQPLGKKNVPFNFIIHSAFRNTETREKLVSWIKDSQSERLWHFLDAAVQPQRNFDGEGVLVLGSHLEDLVTAGR